MKNKLMKTTKSIHKNKLIQQNNMKAIDMMTLVCTPPRVGQKIDYIRKEEDRISSEKSTIMRDN